MVVNFAYMFNTRSAVDFNLVLYKKNVHQAVKSHPTNRHVNFKLKGGIDINGNFFLWIR